MSIESEESMRKSCVFQAAQCYLHSHLKLCYVTKRDGATSVFPELE